MKYLLFVLLFCLPVTAFAAASPPTYEQLAKLPVIHFGDPVPDSDYILQFPAGKPVTISVSIEGSLFAQGAVAELAVTPSREIFVFREWASLDGLKWLPRSELIKSDVVTKIPGYNYPLPGILKVRMDLVEPR
ncbi:MAG TPA: hypothetical protein VMJ66_09145 [Geobacteraceae bacterium]|nr:hypothetical protein [Geobacteraceae bacterium]